MPHINEMIPSKYLKKEDVPRPMLVTIKAVEYANVGQEGKPEYAYLMWFTELAKPLWLKSTNIQLAAAALSSDQSEDWTNKKIVIFTDPNVSMQGKLVGGIRLRAPTQQGQNRATPARPTPAPAPSVPHAEEEPPAFDDDIPF
jgi:hypothetical protein